MITDLNLFFVQEMLKPINLRAWWQYKQRGINAKFRTAHPGYNAAASRTWRQDNPGAQRISDLAWDQKNPGVGADYTRNWRKENPDKMRKSHRKYLRARRAVDSGFALLQNLRNRTKQAFKRGTKGAGTLELLGMEIPEFKIYLQGQFLPGMTWENYGPVWHIDHIRPCASFDLTDLAQQHECFNWSNCQPLFAEDNLRKGAHF